MKLYCHPFSTTSRPILLLAAENDIPLQLQVVDLFTGEQYGAPFRGINPNCQVPVLEDGDFRLAECSAILKYLADKTGSPLYPTELRQRARVNERMDWVNTQLCRELAYGLVYPQILPTHKRRSAEAHEATLQWGRERAAAWMKVFDEHILGANNAWMCGDAMTIADYFASTYIKLGEVVGSDYAAYPNVQRWYERMKSLKSWKHVHETIDGFAATLDRNALQAL